MFVSEIVVNDTLSIPFIILYIALPFSLVQRFLWTASNFLHGTTCLFSSPISFFLLLILNFGPASWYVCFLRGTLTLVLRNFVIS